MAVAGTSAPTTATSPWRPPADDPRALDPEALFALEAELPARKVRLSWAAARPDGTASTPSSRRSTRLPRGFPLEPSESGYISDDPDARRFCARFDAPR